MNVEKLDNTKQIVKPKMLDKDVEKTILTAQENEITEHFIYEKLSGSIKDPHNTEVLRRISNDELKHYNFWKEYTHRNVKPNNLTLWKYFFDFKNFRDNIWNKAYGKK